MSKCKVHNVRFYRPKPKAIYCMALHPKDKKLAVSRSDASIEIWNLNHAPFAERTIACSTENFSIEGLAWCEDSLFSVGLHGLLIEYDLYKLCVKNRAVVTGEAAFCLDVNRNKSEIAIGTEHGYLNVFEIVNGEVLFKKFFDKQEGRILCLKYDHSGEFIVSGGLDAVRIWSVATGHALHKMTTGRAELRKPTIVWCLAVTADFTIISGDSRGKLTFWDGKVGSQINSYQSHRADILSLCVSEDESSLYCAGIDPNISNYVKVALKDGSNKWVKSIQRKIHEHDVRALAMCGEKLFSSGVDGYLACSYHPPKTLMKFPPILQNPCVSVAGKARLILLRYPKCLEIWSLGESDDDDKPKDGKIPTLPLKKVPKKLILLHKTIKDDDGEEKKEGITCACISDGGKWIMYSTRLGCRLFQLNYAEGSAPELIPVEVPQEISEVASNCAVFSPRNHLILAPNCGGLVVLNLKTENPTVLQTLKTDGNDTVTLLTISQCGRYLVAGDPKSNIWVWVLKSKDNQFLYDVKLPKYQVPPTALAVHPQTLNLVVTYADNHIIEYDLKKHRLSDFSRSLLQKLPRQWTSRHYPIRNITFDPKARHIIILQDDNSIVVINKDKKVPTADAKIPKIDFSQLSIEGGDAGDKGRILESHQHSFHSIKKYKHLVHLSWLSDDEMVAVEVNPLGLVEQLPPCFVQNTFGRK